jgi:hypothetical protein
MVTESNEQDSDIISKEAMEQNPYIHAADRDKTKMLQQVLQWGTREERMKKREQVKTISSLMAEINEEMRTQMLRASEESNFVDWSNHTDESIYFSFSLDAYVSIEQDTTYETDSI